MRTEKILLSPCRGLSLLLLVLALAACGGGGSGGGGVPGPVSTYAVTYDGNGHTDGMVPTDSSYYSQNQTVIVLDNTGNLTMTGYSFNGWNTRADGNGNTYTQGQTFAMGPASITLYAKWTSNPVYTVTYDGNGHTGGSAPIDFTGYEQGQTIAVLGNTGNLTKGGFSFAGWNTQADGYGTTYLDGETIPMGSANVTLYAKWPIVEPTLVSIQDNVFTPRCATSGCHRGANPAGGLNLETGNSFGELVNVSSQTAGLLVVPQDPDNSVLIMRLEQDLASPLLMPPGQPTLSQETIDAVRLWISTLF